MGFFAAAVAERKAMDPLALFAEIARAGRTSKAGQVVNLETAIRVATFFACLKVLSQGVAQVPFKLFQEGESNGLAMIKPARGHRLYDVVSTMPNDWQTSFEFREQMVIHAAIGNAYAWKNRTINGIVELILLDPARMVVEQPNEYEPPIYKYTGKDGFTLPMPAEQIWHVRGPSWSGFLGFDVIGIARDVLGLTLAIEGSVSGLHKNGAQPSGVYTVDATLNDEQHKKLTKWLKDQAAEPGTPLVMDRSAKWLAQTMTSIDAQTREMRSAQIEEVCRIMGVMPIMVGYSDKASTYASSEQMFLAHVIHTLNPWYARIEQSADVNLLTKMERARGYYFKFNANGLMRGAAKDRAEYYGKALGSGGGQGWMTADEVRQLEEMNPMGGDAAKIPPGSSNVPVADTSVQDAKSEAQTEQVAKAITEICEVKSLVNMSLLASKTTIPPPNVEVKTGDTYLTLPEGMVKISNEAPRQDAPQVTVNLPEAAPAVINVAPPQVKVAVAAPVVSFEAVMPTPNVIVSLPTRKTDTTITRDRDGNILTATQIEKDV